MTPNLVLITGPDLRHRYFVNRLNREFPIECVFVEQLSYPEFDSWAPKDQAAWEWFFHRRDEFEKSAFAESDGWTRKNSPQVISISAGTLNSADTLKLLQARQPELIIVFGASLIGQPILDCFPDRILNLHVGISGQYRGSSCNFWPIHDGRLDCLGATLMKINATIDAGEILAQKTISLEHGDNEQTLMGKTLILGADMTIQTLHQNWQGGWQPLPLEKNGKLFLKSDFRPEPVAKVRKMVEGGQLTALIRKHLEAGEEIT